MRFSAADARRLPEHWQHFGQRTSPFTGGPRFAANPGNALLNYAYAMLEAETRIACLTVGLDPTLGVVHADYGTRDSFALDLMEPIRPHVDRHILDLLRTTTFRFADFFETRRGGCRLLPPTTRQLADATPWLAQLVAPVAEQAARLFQEHAGNPGGAADAVDAGEPSGRPCPPPQPPDGVGGSCPPAEAGAALQTLRWTAPTPRPGVLRRPVCRTSSTPTTRRSPPLRTRVAANSDKVASTPHTVAPRPRAAQLVKGDTRRSSATGRHRTVTSRRIASGSGAKSSRGCTTFRCRRSHERLGRPRAICRRSGVG